MKVIKIEDVDASSVKRLQFSLIQNECTIRIKRTTFRAIGDVDGLEKKIKETIQDAKLSH